jgi:hypothetical protein
MTTQDTTTVEIRDNAYWPDEAVLIDFAEQDARAEKDDRVEQADQPVKDDSAYAALYFVS